MARMEARFVKIEGLEKPCLIVCPQGHIPDELVIDYGQGQPNTEAAKTGEVIYRLQPSSTLESEPAYVEMFDE